MSESGTSFLSKTIEKIRETVSIFDLLSLYGIYFKGDGTSESQIHCPFHGKDVKASSRVYPDTNKIWCFYCNESLDQISFVKKYEGFSYYQAVSFLVDRFDVKLDFKLEETLESIPEENYLEILKERAKESKIIKKETVLVFLNDLENKVIEYKNNLSFKQAFNLYRMIDFVRDGLEETTNYSDLFDKTKTIIQKFSSLKEKNEREKSS